MLMLSNLLGLDRAGLEAFFIANGDKKFRATQVMKWIHQLGVTDFQQMNNLSKELRNKLSEISGIQNLQVAEDQMSKDDTRKWSLELPDGNNIEEGFIQENERGTLYLNLSTAEIISQVWLAAHLLEEEKKPGRKITNVVMMGMGEPLLNFDNVVNAVRIMMDDFAYGLSKRRVTVSTAGVVPAMDRLGDTLDMGLAV